MTAEELLKISDNIPTVNSIESDEKCIIDPETREISIPSTYRILGVESDEKVERIEFQCPKIVGDNIDLSKLQLRINFRNANREDDQYIIEDVTVNGDNIEFSWLLSRKVTAYQGTVQFIVCAVKVSGSEITNEWNTTLAEATVLEGLEIESTIDEESSDVIEQLIQIIQDTSSSAVSQIQAIKNETVERLSGLPTIENHVVVFGETVT